jgi:hypothetical protein
LSRAYIQFFFIKKTGSGETSEVSLPINAIFVPKIRKTLFKFKIVHTVSRKIQLIPDIIKTQAGAQSLNFSNGTGRCSGQNQKFRQFFDGSSGLIGIEI